ncbi:MAG: hypothetical protein EBS82_07545 [Methylocystaceae bacterium]|jgi:hypothetical protein|nr:hypothetical protein [Methylocystaceae bacterium]
MITPGRLPETQHFTSANPTNREFVAKLRTKIANFSRQNYAIILNLQALTFVTLYRFLPTQHSGINRP